MNNRRIVLSLILFCLLSQVSVAQALKNGRSAVPLKLSEIESLDLPKQDNQALLKALESKSSKEKFLTFATPLEVNFNFLQSASKMEDGEFIVYRLRVNSADAHSLNFGFSDYQLPDQARLVIYSVDGQQMQGPFTLLDNKAHNQLWTPIIESDDVIIELTTPIKYLRDTELNLQFVNHDFKGVQGALSQSCNVDVICGDEDGLGIVDNYRDIIQSVGMYTRNGTRWCTGFLVNTTAEDCRPIFMTAAHCGMGGTAANSMVIYWNYQNSTCRTPGSSESGGAGDGDISDTNRGASALADWDPTDMTVLELDDPVSPTANDFRAGWSRSKNLTDTMICVHHPNTDEKRISFDYNVGRFVDESGSSDTITDTHVQVDDWDLGSTEGGSSGSPLFNNKKQVIGFLTGGGAACGNNLEDVFGSISRSWEGSGSSGSRIKDHLDPENLDALELDGRNCGLGSEFIVNELSVCQPDTAFFTFIISDRYTDNQVSLIIRQATGDLLMEIEGGEFHSPGDTVSIYPVNQTFQNVEYSFIVAVDGNDQILRYPASFNTYAGIPLATNLLLPANNAEDLSLTPALSWEEQVGAEMYKVSVYDELESNNAIFERFTSTNSVTIDEELNALTHYYWEVDAMNSCGAKISDTRFNFRTGYILCTEKPEETVTSTPISLVEGVFPLSLMVTQEGILSKINSVSVEIDHTYVGDLSAQLVHPDGRSIQLFNRIDEGSCNADNMEVRFSDAAEKTHSEFLADCSNTSPASSGEYQPAESLAVFNNSPVNGEWTIILSDNADEDGGTFTKWSMDYCTISAEPIVYLEIDDVVNCNSLDFTSTLKVLPGWKENESITIDIEGIPMPASYSVNPDTFSLGNDPQITIENLAKGDYSLVINATGDMGTTVSIPWNVYQGFSERVIPPVNDQVIENVPIVKFDWSDYSEVDMYRLEVSRDTFFSVLYITALTNISELTIDTFDTTLGEKYFWRYKTLLRCPVPGYQGGGKFTIGTVNNQEIAEVSNYLQLFPNPTRQEFTIHSLMGIQIEEITVFDISGRMVLKEYPKTVNFTSRSNLNAGIYSVMVRTDRGIGVKRLIISD